MVELVEEIFVSDSTKGRVCFSVLQFPLEGEALVRASARAISSKFMQQRNAASRAATASEYRNPWYQHIWQQSYRYTILYMHTVHGSVDGFCQCCANFRQSRFCIVAHMSTLLARETTSAFRAV